MSRQAVVPDPWEAQAASASMAADSTITCLGSDLPIINPAMWQGKDPPDRKWLLDDWIPVRQASYLTGPGSAGKSLLAQELCTCIALGLPFMGIPTRQSVALYLTCEDGDDELHRRQAAICTGLDVELADMAGKLFLVSLAGKTGNELATFSQTYQEGLQGQANDILRPTRRWHSLSEVVKAIGVGFIALDNVAHLFAGNENNRNEVASFVNLLNRLAISVDGAVLFIGHPNKAGAEFSGSTAWENQVRSRLFLHRPDSELDGDIRELTAAKTNYAAKGSKLRFRWHKGAFVRDEDLPESFREQVAYVAQANADNDTFLKCLDLRNAQNRPVSESKASRTYAPKEFADMAESGDVGRPRLEAAMDRLFRIDVIETGAVCTLGRKDRFGVRRKCADLAPTFKQVSA